VNRLCIRLTGDETALVQAEPDQVQELEGNYYIHPDCIDADRFETSDRIYNCPVKGTSYWVDVRTDRGYLNDICWIYPDPLPDYSRIAGWYGFYPTHRKYEIET
jgi:uncharacterized protein (DUF427 family)